MFDNMKEEFHEWLNINYFTPSDFEKASSLIPIRVGANVAKPHYHIGPRITPYFYILCVVEGEGQFIQNGKTFQLRKNDIFCLFPHVTHEYFTNAEKPLKKVFLAFNGDQAHAILEKIGLTPEQPHSINRLSSAALLAFQQLYAKQKNDLSRISLMYTIFEELYYTESHHKDKDHSPISWLEKGRAYIKLHYADMISIEQVADYVGIERTHFSKRFQQEYGQSPMHFLQQLRMNEAKLLLQETEYKMSEIAHSVGFSDLPTFSKAFKKRIGISPAQYRQQFKR